jgi:hypothetical protein
VRVPANQFDAALSSIEKLSSNVIQRGISGSDVTEEFIDLEARIRTQKALELQFLTIMKQSENITDALEVQRQIAAVRTEIEKLEGRRRFLENRASLSTITVDLKSPIMIAVNTSSFGRSLRESVSDSVDVASADRPWINSILYRDDSDRRANNSTDRIDRQCVCTSSAPHAFGASTKRDSGFRVTSCTLEACRNSLLYLLLLHVASWRRVRIQLNRTRRLMFQQRHPKFVVLLRSTS